MQPNGQAQDGVSLSIMPGATAENGNLTGLMLKDDAGNFYVLRSRSGTPMSLQTNTPANNSPSREAVQNAINAASGGVEAVMFQRADGTAVTIPRNSVLVAAPQNVNVSNIDMATLGIVGAGAALFGIGGLAMGGESPGPISLLAAGLGATLAFVLRDDINRVISGAQAPANPHAVNPNAGVNRAPVVAVAPTAPFSPSSTPAVPPNPGLNLPSIPGF